MTQHIDKLVKPSMVYKVICECVADKTDTIVDIWLGDLGMVDTGEIPFPYQNHYASRYKVSEYNDVLLIFW